MLSDYSGNGVESVLCWAGFLRPLLGWTVVCEGDSLLGFVHAGFGPDEQRTGLDLRTGVICALSLDPELASRDLAEALLLSGEEYLVGRGSRQIFVGGSFFPEPFWTGLAQGGRLPGIPAEHHLLREVLESHGYRPVARRQLFEVSLVGSGPTGSTRISFVFRPAL